MVPYKKNQGMSSNHGYLNTFLSLIQLSMKRICWHSKLVSAPTEETEGPTAPGDEASKPSHRRPPRGGAHSSVVIPGVAALHCKPTCTDATTLYLPLSPPLRPSTIYEFIASLPYESGGSHVTWRDVGPAATHSNAGPRGGGGRERSRDRSGAHVALPD